MADLTQLTLYIILNFSNDDMKFDYWLILAMTLSGASALIYEVVASKVLFFFFSETTYSVATVLASFLFGLALGSFLMAKYIKKIIDKRQFFVVLQVLIGVYAILFFTHYETIPYTILKFLNIFGVSQFMIQLSKFLVGLSYLLVPTLFLGASFPLVSSMLVKKVDEAGVQVGLLYSFDLVGAILGAFIAGFLLLPNLGIKLTVVIASGLNFLGAFIILRKNFNRILVLVVIICLSLLTVNFQSSYSPSKITDFQLDETYGEIIYQEQSPYGWISVVNDTEKGLSMYINYRVQCGTKQRTSEKEIAHSVLNNFDKPVRVMNIGLGCGFTLQAILEHKNVISVDVIEINPVMRKVANEYFAEENNYSAYDSRVNIIIDDGAHYLVENEYLYDAIIIDIENPAVAHSSPLYTVEYFKIISKRLTEDGVFGLWAFTGTDDYLSIMYFSLKQAFSQVYFKEVVDYLFIASKKELNQIGLTESDLSQLKHISQRTESEINTLDKQVLDKYFQA